MCIVVCCLCVFFVRIVCFTFDHVRVVVIGLFFCKCVCARCLLCLVWVLFGLSLLFYGVCFVWFVCLCC